ncbi:MAG: citrate synthase family protein [Gammaproteobacteria bacterium]|nr:citrate synthase family protein [Gammaproteobacteria bacterium]
MKTPGTAWLDTEEATALLGVSRATLYAYVSRGRVRSEPVPGSTRRRRYARDDIERLRARTAERRNPEKAAEQALHWGLPILQSAITLIAEGRIYYRGRDAAALAREASLADVAALLWTGRADGTQCEPTTGGTRTVCAPATAAKRTVPQPSRGGRGTARPGSSLPFVARAQAALARASAEDPAAYDLRPQATARTGWRIVELLATVAAPARGGDRTIDEALAHGWDVPDAAALLRAAMILCADHELNVSAFTARCVASAGTSPYGVVIAGLAALEGTKHGGTTARVEALWESLRGSADLPKALTRRLRRGEPIDGFGHPLYAAGDPRAAVLLEMLPSSQNAAFARDIAGAAEAVLGEAPTVDFALVALTRSLGLPDGAALTLFALGRTIGWIAHAIEQYAQDAIIRPRARYVGENPA